MQEIGARCSCVDPTPLRCPQCGIFHRNVAVLHSYPACSLCQCILELPEVLQQSTHPAHTLPGTQRSYRLQVLFASYGLVNDERGAVVVTEGVRRRVAVGKTGHRLYIRDTEPLRQLLGVPEEHALPEGPKVLTVRYKTPVHFATIRAYARGDGKLVHTLSLTIPDEAAVRIHTAYWGHPKGPRNGRFARNVAEELNGLCDLAGGRYVHIPRELNLAELWGDPCSGKAKQLVASYEIDGRVGELKAVERRGRIAEDLTMNVAAIIAPQVIVHSARYGICDEDVQLKMAEIDEQLRRIRTIEGKKASKSPLTTEQIETLKTKPHILRDKELLTDREERFVDVTAQLQHHIDDSWGQCLLLPRDLNLTRLFGNPCPDMLKLLAVEYEIIGHDSEKLTTSEEVTVSGHQCNYIRPFRGSFVVIVDDEIVPVAGGESDAVIWEEVPGAPNPHIHSRVRMPIEVRAQVVQPLIQIQRAVYGHPRDFFKTFDVTSAVQAHGVAKNGRAIEILKSRHDLPRIFGDPCPGVIKTLNIAYMSRGFRGNVRLDERDGHLAADFTIGYVPTDVDRATRLQRLRGIAPCCGLLPELEISAGEEAAESMRTKFSASIHK